MKTKTQANKKNLKKPLETLENPQETLTPPPISEKPSRNVLIGLSWPYANGRLHIGHAASSLPADALARYHRMIGNEVAFVSGSDCYGTPILVAAKSEGIAPTELSDKYHQYHTDDFNSLNFTFDNYTKTTTPTHGDFVRCFHRQMYDGKYVFEKTEPQLYCGTCVKYLPDRFVEGTCPHCKADAKGDSCDGCGKILEPEDLVDPKCKLCSGNPVARDTKQLYLALSKLEPEIRKFYDLHKDSWANNAIGLTGRYLKEGLHDRAITRNIEWGVGLPPEAKSKFNLSDEEFAEKKIYIWAENVLGYLSAAKEVSASFTETPSSLFYFVHAKDNIPFHSIILPGLLIAGGKELPQWIMVSSEYVRLADNKMSKSTGNMITIKDLVCKYDPDMIRFYFLRNVNDRKDVNFTEEDFKAVINSELINGFGNLVNRTLSFINSKLDGKLDIKSSGNKEIFNEVGKLIHEGKTNKALAKIWEVVTAGNKLFDESAPWKSIKEDVKKCEKDLGEVVTIIANLARLLYPFIPTACEKIARWLGVALDKWEPVQLKKTISLGEIAILWTRLT
ncbi:MAG: methionine--tRNA ligase [Firmicutes bacterium]|nr:methionine--tRNA ligase [Bacillota bacterium]